MARKRLTTQEQIEYLTQQKDKIIKRLQIAIQKADTKQRAQDTKRKILVGAYVMDKRKELYDEIISSDDFAAYLTRNCDRKVFDLPLIETPKEQTQGGKTSGKTSGKKHEKAE